MLTTEDDNSSEQCIFGIVHFEKTHGLAKVEQSICRIAHGCTFVIFSRVRLIVGIDDGICFDVILSGTAEHHDFARAGLRVVVWRKSWSIGSIFLSKELIYLQKGNLIFPEQSVKTRNFFGKFHNQLDRQNGHFSHVLKSFEAILFRLSYSEGLNSFWKQNSIRTDWNQRRSKWSSVFQKRLHSDYYYSQ